MVNCVLITNRSGIHHVDSGQPWDQPMEPTSILLDNLGTVTLSNDMSYHKCIKYTNVADHFICEKVASNKAILTYVQSKEHPADLMTKSLDSLWHRYLHAKLGFVDDSEVRGSVGFSNTSDAKASPN